MSMFLPRRWMQQPQYPVGINAADRYGRAAAFFFYRAGGRGYEAVTGSIPTIDTATAKVVAGPFGEALIAANYSGSTKTVFADLPRFDCAGPLTIVAVLKSNANTNYGAIVANQDTPDVNGFEFRLAADISGSTPLDLNRAGVSGTKASYAGATTSTSLITVGTVACVAAISGDDGTSVAVAHSFAYANGAAALASVTGNQQGSGTGAAGRGQKLYFGQRADAVTKLTGEIHWVIGFNERLTVSDIEAIRRRPWSLLIPISQRVYSFPATAIAYLLTVSATTAVSASAVRAIGASKSASKAASASMVRSVGVTRTATQGSSAVVVRSIGAIRGASSSCGAAIIRAITATEAATSACGAAIVRAMSATTAAAQGLTGSIVRDLALTRDIAQSCAVSAGRAVATSVMAGQASGAVILRAIVKTLSAAQSASASIARSIGVVRAATQGSSGTSIRNTGIGVSASQTSSAAITRSIGVIVSAITSIIATLIRTVLGNRIVPGRACITVSQLGTVVSIAYATATVSVR